MVKFGCCVMVVAATAITGVMPLLGQGVGTIEVGTDRLVSADIEDRPVVEPWLATHPEDSSKLLATAMVAAMPLPPAGEGLAAESICATWLSADGGESWVRHDHPIAGCADPWIVTTAAGTAVFTALGEGGAYVFRSPDGGASWNDGPVSMGDGHDHPILVVDRTDGPFSGHVYFASGRGGLNRERQFRYTVYVARSRDDARSFPFVEQVIASNLSYEAQVPAVLSDGTLLVPFSDHHTMQGERLAIGARRSWAVRSKDGGNTFTEPLFITDACDGRGGWPMLASGPDDRVWFTCVAAESAGVLVFRSDDEGETWSGPVRVGRGGPDRWTRTPTLAVTEDGVVGLAWYDRTHDPGRSCQHLVFAASLDGGASFSPSTRVSSAESCPSTKANGWTGGRFPAGGDYSGLAATGNGTFRVLWSDARDGLYRLRTATVTVHP